MDLNLTGKRAIVTGGSGGIGRAIARALIGEGVRVVIAARDVDRLQQTATELAASGGEVHPIAVDTNCDGSVEAMIANAVSMIGGIDIVVNAAARAGTLPLQPGIAGVSSDEVLGELNNKLVGYLRVARGAAPFLVANGWGRIINISGLGARRTGSIPVSVRNVAVAALSKGLADELGPKGVNVTTVYPGATRTERTASAIAQAARDQDLSEAEAERRLYGGSLIGRIVEPEEVAAVVVFLASPRSAAITGDAIAVGGGTPGPIYY